MSDVPSGSAFLGHDMPNDTDLWSGLIRLHVLHHAAQGDLFGLGMIQELRRHGYEMSPGTLYPMLHRLERRGYLASRTQKRAGHSRRVYRITAEGRTALGEARQRVQELFHELFEEAPWSSRSLRPSSRGSRS